MMKITALAAVALVGFGLALAGPSEGRSQTPEGPPNLTGEPQKTLFAITFSPGPAWKPGLPFRDQGLEAHFYYWKDLFEAGDVIAAGGLGPQDGLVLFHAADQAGADQLVARDPAVTAGIFVGEARPYSPSFLSNAPLVIRKP